MIFPSLAIIVVNYNQIHHTLECLNSLLSANAELNQIIVVDNASNDKSVEVLKNTYGSVLTILDLSENKGYPYGLNQGIPIALEKNAEWLLLMNNDVIVDNNFLVELKNAVIENPKACLIGPAILYYDQKEIIWYMGSRIIPGTLIGIRTFRGHKYHSKFPKYMSTDFVHGCTMMVKKDVFNEIGLFDDENLIYGDDADFSWRARCAGFKMLTATQAKMWHKISLTMGLEKPRTRYLRTRNTIAFYRKYTSGLKMIIMFLFTIAKGSVRIIKDIFKGNMFLIKPLILGTIDGWFNAQQQRNIY